MYAPVSSHMNFHVWVMLIVLSILWGTSFIFTEIALEDFRPLTIATLRVSGAASALWIYLLIIGAEIPRSLSIWGAFLIMGIVNNAIPFAAIMFAQTLISASLASILNSTAPLFTVVLAGILLSDERITTARIFAVILGFIGVVVMIGPPALLGFGADVLAQCAVLGASVSYAFSAVFARRFKAMGLQPSVLAVGMLTMSSLCLAPVAIFFDRPFALECPRNFSDCSGRWSRASFDCAGIYSVLSHTRRSRSYEFVAGYISDSCFSNSAWSELSR